MTSFIDELSAIKESFQVIIDNLRSFAWEIDTDGKIIDIKAENEEILKNFKKLLIGKSLIELFFSNHSKKKIKSLLNRSRSVINISTELFLGNNTKIDVLFNAISFPDNNKKVNHYKAIISPLNQISKKETNIYDSLFQDITKDLILLIEIKNNFKIVRVNNTQLKNFLSYSKEDIIGMSLWNIVYARDKKKLKNRIKNGLSAHETIEVRLKIKKEDYKWFEVKTIKRVDKVNSNNCIVVLSDISVRKDLEKQIRLSEERLKTISDSVPEIRYWKLLQPKQSMSAIEKSREMLETIIDTIPQLIYWKDKNLNYLGANKKFLEINKMGEINEIFGKKDEDLIWSSLFQNTQKISQKEKQVLKKESADYHSIESFRKRNGDIVWYDINRIPLQDTRGEVEGILTTYENITQRKLAEQRIKESELKYRNMINNLDLGFFRVNEKAIIKDHNPKLCVIFGYERETDLVGASAYSLWEDQHELQNYMTNIMKVGASRNILYGARKRNGEKIFLQVDSHILLDNKSKGIEIEGTIFDVTEKIMLEKKLKESEEKYRSLVNNISDAIFELKPDGTITYVSPQVKDLFGYTPEEMINKNALDYIVEGEKDKLINGMRESLETSKLVSVEYTIRHKKGKRKVVLGKGGIVEIHGQKKFIGIIRDITKQKEAEQKLKESRENYRLITENVNDLISVINNKLRYEYINEKIHKKVLGYTKEDLIGKSALHYIHPEDKTSSYKALIEGREKGRGAAELRFKNKEGEYIWLEVKGQGFTNEKGEFKGYLVSRDVTERKKAEQKIRESEEKLKRLNKRLELKVEERTKKLRESEQAYRDMINNLDVGFFKTGLNGPIKIHNRAFNNILGFDLSKSLKGETIKDFFMIEEEYRNYYDLLLEKGSIRNLIVRFKNIDEGDLFVQINAHLIGKKGENTKEVEGTFIDVTEKFKLEQKLKESESNLREQNIELKKLDQLKNDFITMAAHELKTPLISIGGYIDLILLREEQLKEEIREELLRVLHNTKRLEAYVDQLMDVMKIDAKKMDFEFDEANVYDIINESLNALHFQIRKKNINIHINVDPNITLVIDSFRISQVFSNLLSNAVKFTNPNGNITISAKRQEDFYLFEVKDDGKGLNNHEMDLLFEKFVSLKKDLEKFSRGSGLGLYISKGIIQSHKGKIWVESEGKDKGSTFKFTLPILND